jgi:hypothetical protein
MLQHQYDNYLNNQSPKLLKFWLTNEIKPSINTNVKILPANTNVKILPINKNNPVKKKK